ncbi:hypothetical protein [Nocardia sp. IFM 10818]
MSNRLPAALRDAAEWVRRFARTAPGTIGAVGAGLAILCLIAGLVSASQLSAKMTQRDTVLANTEPLANASQRLYVALSSADAAASSAFLSGGIESADVRSRYRQALADAAAALAEATTGASDQETRVVVARISAELPTYTGLVESARANNRQGLPVGSAYLRQASDLMQNSLLRDAELLEQNRLAHLHAEQDGIASLPWLSVTLLIAVLLACALGSLMLLRRTNRRVNLGVAAAAGAAVLLLLWIGVATIAASTAIDGGPQGATARFETLVKVRILAQQARTEETMLLVTRGDLDESEGRFATRSTELRDHLLSVVGSDAPATQAYASWQDGHREQIEAYRGNDYRGAVDQAIGTGVDDTATRFAALDVALRDELARTRAELRDDVDAAGDALMLSPLVALVLLVGAAGAVGVGVWPRLKEFL